MDDFTCKCLTVLIIIFSIKFFVYARPPAGVESGLGRYVGPFLHENLEARLATSARKLTSGFNALRGATLAATSFAKPDATWPARSANESMARENPATSHLW